MKVCRFFRLLAIAGIACQVPIAIADDWTQWRGNQRDGKSLETGLMNQWSSSGPKLIWQTNGLGSGFSTPSSANGLVYLVTNTGMETEQLIALELASGKTRWKTKIGAVGANTGPQYPGSRSTPALNDGKVYVLGSDGDLVCVDAQSGTVVWSKNLRKEYQGVPGKWAYTESPLIDGDSLICSPGGKNATVVSLNKKDGSLRWKSPIPEADEASYSSPVAAEMGGKKQYVLFMAKGVAGLNAENGEYLWRFDKTADKDANVQTPIIKDSFVFTGASRVGGGLAEVIPGNRQPKQVYFDTKLPTGMGGAVLVGNHLYGTSGPTLMCVEFSTGKIMWQDRSIGAASICYADNKLFLHGENNDLAMVAATPEGYKELGRVTPPGAPDRGRSKAWTHPMIADGKLIIHDSGSVWCYDLRGS